MDSNLVTNILESAKRKLAKPVTKKEPITVKMYPRLFCDCHVKNQRIICACLIGYAGLFRSNLRRCDIMIILLL